MVFWRISVQKKLCILVIYKSETDLELTYMNDIAAIDSS